MLRFDPCLLDAYLHVFLTENRGYNHFLMNCHSAGTNEKTRKAADIITV